MGLSNKQVGLKLLAKIQIYILTRAELLFTLCSEIPGNIKMDPYVVLNPLYSDLTYFF